LPRELRDVIYGYALTATPRSHRKAETGLGLLPSSSQIYEETAATLYESQLFGITFDTGLDVFEYRHMKPGDMAPHGGSRIEIVSLDRLKNLHIYFKSVHPGTGPKRLQKGILQLCNCLRSSARLQYLDINIEFMCEFNDIEDMSRLLDPIKMLRGISDTEITVYGYQFERGEEPRWDLTDEYSTYLQQQLMSPHDAPTPSDDGIPVFEDLFEPPDLEDDSRDPSDKVTFQTVDPRQRSTVSTEDDVRISLYLRDVYNTTDRMALHGNMPERWQVWLALTDEEPLLQD
jgi:hypothetical protein